MSLSNSDAEKWINQWVRFFSAALSSSACVPYGTPEDVSKRARAVADAAMIELGMRWERVKTGDTPGWESHETGEGN